MTNTGNVALSNVSVTDDKCHSPSYVSGDMSPLGWLGLTETWTFTCSMTITADTVNVATAHGFDGTVEVTDQDTASVTVAAATNPPTVAPTLPPTNPPTVAPSPVQSVLGATSRPSLPPSDALFGKGGSGDSWRIILAAISTLLASALLMVPLAARRRR